MAQLEVQILPILEDNYVFIISDGKDVVVVDPGEAFPVQEELVKRGLHLSAILLTHHHNDHIGGAFELKDDWQCPVYAPLKNKEQIPFATDYVVEGQSISLLSGKMKVDVIELPGHTLGHVAFVEKQQHWIFSGDVLFGLGCGRLFEGTPKQAFDSLQKIKALADETLVYCTHEYTEANLRFCKKVMPEQELASYEKTLMEKRKAHQPSVPLILSVEKAVNPFLSTNDVQRFTELRELRNRG